LLRVPWDTITIASCFDSARTYLRDPLSRFNSSIQLRTTTMLVGMGAWDPAPASLMSSKCLPSGATS
jgi:hypothetical protein